MYLVCLVLLFMFVAFLDTPAFAEEEINSSATYREVSYGPFAENVLDLWKAEGEGPRPLVVQIHGGGWTAGNRVVSSKVVNLFLKKGISYASIEYRFSTVAPLPAPVRDAARAIQFLRSKAEEWNIDKIRIAVTGGSAGGCTSMWLLTHDDLADPDAEDPVLRESTRVFAAAIAGGQTCIDPKVIEGWAGPNVLKHRMIWMSVGEKNMASVFANYEKHKEIYYEFSPYNHLTKDDPPLFMYYDKSTKLPSEDANHGIHHPVFGIKMKEKSDSLGHECYLVIKGEGKPGKYKSKEEFLIDKLLN